MRIGLLAAFILVLAACSTPHHPASSSKPLDTPSMVAKAPEMTDEEFKNYIGGLAEQRLTAICGERQTLSSQFECVTDTVFRGFDTSGEAKRNCDANGSLDSLLRCAIIGSMGYQLAIDARLEQAENYNWQDPEAGLKDTLAALAKENVEACLQASLATIDTCVMDRVGKSFSLSDQQIASCTDTADSDKTLQCLIRIHLIQRFEAAIARMGNGDGQRA
jgi:hypothetical protein